METEKSSVDYEATPLTRSEYVTALAHFYRGEMHRAQAWRSRLDTTTNWAVIATLGIMTFSFNNPAYSMETLIAGMYVNLVFLLLEARRFRFFDVWRSRVRMIEENFMGPILRRDLGSSTDLWGKQVADDLLHPRFKIALMQAVKARLTRNYIFVFGFLLLAWLGRIFVLSRSGEVGLDNMMGIVGVSGWIPVLLVVGLYGTLIGVMVFTPKVLAPEKCYWPDPDHQGQEVSSLDV